MKILVCGDVRGNFKKLFARAGKALKKSKFDAMFCVGEIGLDGEEIKPFIEGTSKVPLPTFFVCGWEGGALVDNLPEGGEICPNLNYLGRSGIATVSGLTVGFLSGVYNPVYYRDSHKAAYRKTKYEEHYCKGDVDNLISAYTSTPGRRGIDVLLTCEWGRGYHTTLSKEQLPPISSPEAVGSPIVARIATAMAARYHFAGLEGVHLQLRPYTTSSSFCRFVALGAIAGDKAHKSVYACAVTPVLQLDDSAMAPPAGTSPCPYTYTPPKPKAEPVAKKAKVVESDPTDPRFSRAYGLQDDDSASFNRWGLTPGQQSGADPPRNYVCRLCNQRGHFIQDCDKAKRDGEGGRGGGGGGARGEKGSPPDGYVCRRCQTSGHWIQDCPNAETDRECWFCLKGDNVEKHLAVSVGNKSYVALAKGGVNSGHCLILPILHVGSSAQADPETIQEMRQFEEALRKCFKTQRQEVISWDRNIHTRAAQHMQIQVVPIPTAVDADTLLKNAPVPFEKMASYNQVLKELDTSQYLAINLGSEVHVHTVGQDRVRGLFDYARVAVTTVLGCPERADWRQCKTSKAEETKATKALQALFAPFDFMADSDDDED